MLVTCPCCHARYSVEAAIQDAEAREAVRIALLLPPQLGRMLLTYLGLFRPAERSLSWSRTTRLLVELHNHVKAGEIERKGRMWPAPLEAWLVAMEQMIERRDSLTLPLKTHGYLYEIVVGLADRQEGRVEKDRERSRRHAGDEARSAPAAGRPVEAADIGRHLEQAFAALGRKRKAARGEDPTD